jgi:hypothetical protein
MSGVIFINELNSTILCGYNIKINSISGIGGKPLKNEDLKKTAIREMLEELFELNDKNIIIDYIFNTIKTSRIINSNNYYIYIYTFNDLQIILNILNSYNIQSKLYDVFPTNLCELILNRKTDKATEVSYLSLQPLISNIKFSPDFLHDLQLVHDLVQE